MRFVLFYDVRVLANAAPRGRDQELEENMKTFLSYRQNRRALVVVGVLALGLSQAVFGQTASCKGKPYSRDFREFIEAQGTIVSRTGRAAARCLFRR